jgi:hypothetical protein
VHSDLYIPAIWGTPAIAGADLLPTNRGEEGPADQWISGGWCSHGGAEARREQREESTTGPRGQLACFVFLPVMLEPPWLHTGISTRAPVIHPVRVHK